MKEKFFYKSTQINITAVKLKSKILRTAFPRWFFECELFVVPWVACTKLCIPDRPSLAWELSLCHPKRSELDCYVNEVIQLRQVICLYTKSYCPLESLHKNSHTTGFITLFITLNITHVCQISYLIFWKKKEKFLFSSSSQTYMLLIIEVLVCVGESGRLRGEQLLHYFHRPCFLFVDKKGNRNCFYKIR